jgi:hypothetical protein
MATNMVSDLEDFLGYEDSELLDADDIEQYFDDIIESYEEENNVKISSVSPLKIMTRNLFDNLSGYKKIRIILWVTYILLFIVLILTILGFCMKWSKFIPLICDSIYGLFAVVVFGYLRFGLMGSVAKKIINTFSESGESYWTILSVIGSKVLAQMLKYFYSIAFMFAFILAVLLLIVSILSMFLGNRKAAKIEPVYDDELENFLSDDWDKYSGENEKAEKKMYIETWTPTQPSTNAHKEEPIQPPMGIVKCTKGCSLGQGLRLPQDRKVVVGKSPQNANLVINNQNVSNIHCTIRYNATQNTYIVKDHSLNGTFVNGARIQNNVPMELPAGTVLSLADGSNEVTLG